MPRYPISKISSGEIWVQTAIWLFLREIASLSVNINDSPLFTIILGGFSTIGREIRFMDEDLHTKMLHFGRVTALICNNYHASVFLQWCIEMLIYLAHGAISVQKSTCKFWPPKMLENPIEIMWFRSCGLLQTFVTKLIRRRSVPLSPSSFPLIVFQNCYAFILLPLSSTTRQTMEGCRGMYVSDGFLHRFPYNLWACKARRRKVGQRDCSF